MMRLDVSRMSDDLVRDTVETLIQSQIPVHPDTKRQLEQRMTEMKGLKDELRAFNGDIQQAQDSRNERLSNRCHELYKITMRYKRKLMYIN